MFVFQFTKCVKRIKKKLKLKKILSKKEIKCKKKIFKNAN